MVEISSNYVNGEDSLSFSNQNGISGSWDASSGTLTLSGTATVAEYQTALQSITYTNGSEDPSAATRTISFTVNDGDTDSNTVSRDIAVTPVNDPASVNTNTGFSVAEGGSVVITNAMLNEGDPDDSGAGVSYLIRLGTNGGSIFLDGTVLNANDTFTQADVDAGRVTYIHAGGEDTTERIFLTILDGGEDGAGTTNITVSVSITSVNDAPVAVDDPNGVFDPVSDGDTVGFWQMGEYFCATAVDAAGSNDGTYNNVTLGATGVSGSDTAD